MRRVLLAAAVSTCVLFPSPAAQAGNPRSNACVDEYVNGQKLHRDRRLIEAREALSRCAQDPPCKGFIVDDCARWLGEVEAQLPAVVPVAMDQVGNARSDVHVWMDGVLLAEAIDGGSKDVNPGPHTFTFEASTGEKVERKILVPEGDKALRVVVRFPAPPLVYKPVQTWMVTLGRLLTGAGALWLGVGVAFGVNAWSKRNPAGCDSKGCAPQGINAQSAAYHSAKGSTVSFVIGGVLSASGIGLWIAAPNPRLALETKVATAGFTFQRAW